VFPAGATVRKTVRLAADRTVEADYEVSLAARRSEPAPGEQVLEQAFVAVNSVPVVIRPDSGTRFCWQNWARPGDGAQEKEGMSCMPFTPSAGAIRLPEAVHRLEVRTSNSPGLALEWNAGSMTIEQKRHSALLKLQFPSLTPGAPPAAYRMKYTVVSPE
jgi:hypothetical protein